MGDANISEAVDLDAWEDEQRKHLRQLNAMELLEGLHGVDPMTFIQSHERVAKLLTTERIHIVQCGCDSSYKCMRCNDMGEWWEDDDGGHYRMGEVRFIQLLMDPHTGA